MSTTAERAVAANPRWYHSIELAPGVVTPGLVDLRRIASKVLPPRIEGRALDVGTFDGFWAFELERRGAAEVVAIDVGAADEAQWPPLQRERLRREADALGLELGLGFRLAAEALGSRVRREVCDVGALTAQRVGGPVDVVFVGALLLHLRDPVGALERVRAVLRPGGRLVALEPVALRETLLSPRRPVARFEPLSTAFNWWVANAACLRGWLVAAGFRDVRVRGPHRPRAGEGMTQWHVALSATA